MRATKHEKLEMKKAEKLAKEKPSGIRDKAFFAAVKYSLFSFLSVFAGAMVGMIYEQLKNGLPVGTPVDAYNVPAAIGFIAAALFLHKARDNISKEKWLARFLSGVFYVFVIIFAVCLTVGCLSKF